MSYSFTKNGVNIEPMLVTQEDLGNFASASALLSGSASTSSFALSGVRRSTAAATYVAVGGVAECVANCLVENTGAVCGVRGVVFSLGPTPPSPPVCGLKKSCKFKPFNYNFTII